MTKSRVSACDLPAGVPKCFLHLMVLPAARSASLEWHAHVAPQPVCTPRLKIGASCQGVDAEARGHFSLRFALAARSKAAPAAPTSSLSGGRGARPASASAPSRCSSACSRSANIAVWRLWREASLSASRCSNSCSSSAKIVVWRLWREASLSRSSCPRSCNANIAVWHEAGEMDYLVKSEFHPPPTPCDLLPTAAPPPIPRPPLPTNQAGQVCGPPRLAFEVACVTFD